MTRKRSFRRLIRVLGLAATALVPGALKQAILRSLFGFRIGKRVRIGVAYFDCAELSIEDDASIGHGVIFKNVGTVRVGPHATIGPLNLFRGGDRVELGDYAQVLRLNVINAIPHHDCFGVLDSTFLLGYGAMLASSHWIDFTDRVSIGRCSMLAGRQSSIWTHNRRRAAPVRIGDFCYLGSETRVAPGATIPDCTIVAMGAVVGSSFKIPFTLIAGAPAQVTRRLTEEDADTLFGKTRWDLPDQEVPQIPAPPAMAAPPAIASAHHEPPHRRLDPAAVVEEVKRLVAQAANITSADVDLNRDLVDHGIDSLQLIVLREMVEDTLDIHPSDDAWMCMTRPAHLVAFCTAETQRPALDGGVSPHRGVMPSTSVIAPGLAWEDLEIGMPLTGRNNLAETPLLQRLGDQRWRHLSGAMGVPSRDIVDDAGDRLYATFFYVEMAFPPEKPMATFGENDRFKVVSTLERYGTSMLDGIAYLMPADYSIGGAAPYASLADAVAGGVPAVRLSNIFVKQFAGAAWLKKGRPAHPGFLRIPATPLASDSYAIVKDAEKSGHFGGPAAQWVSMTGGAVRREYRLIPDRDLNGAGLVYFANYPMFLDICERDVLLTANMPLREELIDRRTLVRRRSAYLNNASARDTLLIEIEPWLEVTPTAGALHRDRVTIHVVSRMYRRSDERLMMVSAAEKQIVGASLADLPFTADMARPALKVVR